MRATERLHFSQMSGKLSARWLFMVTPFIPFVQYPQGGHTERADEVFWCEMFPFDINIHDLRGKKID